MKRKYLYMIPALAFVATACEPTITDKISDETYYPGEADFTTYVAIGNSLTAGYMDGTMYRTGQAYSFPNILSQQFKVVGGGLFTQPSFADDVNDVGGLLLGGNALPGFSTKLVMNMVTSSPENIKGTITIDVAQLQKKAYNNTGVPGAKTFHLLATGYGSLANLAVGKANPYFVRTATSEQATVLGDAMSLNPTFFTNWIGANDVLAYATSGGEGLDQNELNGFDPSQYGGNDITHAAVFKGAYETIVNTLTSNGAKGVLATVPDVTAIPFFTTVPYNPLTKDNIVKPGENADEVIAQLNMFIGLFKGILDQAGQGDRFKLFDKNKANPVLIQDKTLTDMSSVLSASIKGLISMGVFPFQLTDPEIEFLASTYGQARHATAKDLMLLTSKAEIGASVAGVPNPALAELLKKGVTYPINDKFVLNKVEQQKVKTATTAFNTIIKEVAENKGLAVADMNELLNKAVSGIRVEDGQIYTADYFKGMANLNTVMFSLDGVHLNARGYAFIASEILRVINKHYKSNIPLVNPATYPGPTLVVKN